MSNVFGNVISRYTRKDAIEDGVLVDLSSKYPNDTRIYKYPVACTDTIWNMIEKACEKTREDLGAYVWDLCYMSLNAKIKILDEASFIFTCGIPLNKQQLFKFVVSGGDKGEPVITIMMPDED